MTDRTRSFAWQVGLMTLCLLSPYEVETMSDHAFAGEAVAAISRETLVNKRFQFSWRSAEGGGVNGIATLGEDGSIRGIGSPNESFWLVDDAGHLLFKHADARVSTRYDEVALTEGLLRFQGPFLLREGITHHLAEIKRVAADTVHQITTAQAARIKYSNQRFVYLDPGETYTFPLKDGTQREIRLTSVDVYRDPVIDLVRRARVIVTINRRHLELTCAPYAMPTEVDGLRIQADTTSDWLNMPKRVQFSLWDASDPVLDPDLFSFPLPGYRLFSQGTQAYNEPVHLGHRDGDPAGQRFYHNYGVDLAGYEGRQKVLSCIDGTVIQINRQEGDLSIADDKGFVLYFGHLDAILSGIEVGTKLKRGQWVGMLGKRGASGNFSHLHIGAGLSLSESAVVPGDMSRNLNLYPWLVAAYQHESKAEVMAVARPFKSVLTGDSVRFDGSACLSLQSKELSCQWEFHDDTRVRGPKAEKVYEKPGCYIAGLWARDDQGNADVDFCRVRVYSRSAPEDVIPTLFVTYKPSRDLRVDQPVSFRIWPQGRDIESIQIQFGDEGSVRDYSPYSAIAHSFKQPGIHVVTVTGRSGHLPVTQKVKVVVAE